MGGGLSGIGQLSRAQNLIDSSSNDFALMERLLRQQTGIGGYAAQGMLSQGVSAAHIEPQPDPVLLLL